MPMKKYAQGEGPVEVFRGEEAEVVSKVIAKVGKSVAEFNAEERKLLHKELDSVKPAEEVPAEAAAEPTAENSE